MYIAIFCGALLVIALLFGNWYLRNHCLGCRMRTNSGKYAYCDNCERSHAEEVEAHKEHFIEESTRIMMEVDAKAERDLEAFGLESSFLDRSCPLCSEGELKTHRMILVERGLSGDHLQCQKFVFSHFEKAEAAFKARESKKFWKRVLYVPPTKEEEAETGRTARMLMGIMLEGQHIPHRQYREKPDHWMKMTVGELIIRRWKHHLRQLGLE